MEISYQRDLNHNYMILKEVNVSGREYTVHMMERNEIPGLLPFQARKVNGKICFCYEITSRQPLARMFEKRGMKSPDIEQLLTGIQNSLAGAHQYLLDSRDILLDPEYIYVEIETRQIQLCCVPGLERNDITVLTEFILKKLDHSDRRAVELGYELYEQSEKDNFSLQETLKQILKDHREEQDYGKEAEAKFREKSPYREEIQEESGGKLPEISYRRRASEAKTPDNRRRMEKKKPRGKNLLLCMLIIAIITALFGVIVWLGKLDLTQTGGLAFLLLALIWMIYSAASGKRQKKKKQWIEEEDEEEAAFMDSLMSELYEEKDFGHEAGQGAQIHKTQEETLCGETRCLTLAEYEMPLRLISLEPDRYPDITLSKEQSILGKKKEQVDIWLESDTVSRLHAKLEKKGEDCFVTDMNSMNGTFLNGERLRPNERRPIAGGDRVSFATFHYQRENR